MKILIVATNVRAYSIVRLETECKSRGIKVEKLEYDQISIEVGETGITWGGVELRNCDAAILRSPMMSAFENYDMSLVRSWLAKTLIADGKYVLNGEMLAECKGYRDKFSQMLILTRAGIRVPRSYYLSPWGKMKVRFSYPVVVKKLISSHGVGVRRVPNQERLERYQGLFSPGNCMVQENLSGKVDYRVIVLSGRALGVMERKAAENRIQTNVSLGGHYRKVVDNEIEKFAERVAKIMELDFAGVDLMRDDRGRLCCLEVDGTPEFKAFERCTKVNVAGKLIDYIRGKI